MGREQEPPAGTEEFLLSDLLSHPEPSELKASPQGAGNSLRGAGQAPQV